MPIKYKAKSKFGGNEYNGDILSLRSPQGTIYYIRPDNSDYSSNVVDKNGKTWFGVQLIEVEKDSIELINN